MNTSHETNLHIIRQQTNMPTLAAMHSSLVPITLENVSLQTYFFQTCGRNGFLLVKNGRMCNLCLYSRPCSYGIFRNYFFFHIIRQQTNMPTLAAMHSSLVTITLENVSLHIYIFQTCERNGFLLVKNGRMCKLCLYSRPCSYGIFRNYFFRSEEIWKKPPFERNCKP